MFTCHNQDGCPGCKGKYEQEKLQKLSEEPLSRLEKPLCQVQIVFGSGGENTKKSWEYRE